MTIDSHVHVWELHYGEFGWLNQPDFAYMRRDFKPDDVLPELSEAGVTGVVLVEASLTLTETERLIELAKRHDEVVGIIGWLPLDDFDVSISILNTIENEYLLGIRHWSPPQVLNEQGAASDAIRILANMAEHDLVFEVFIQSTDQIDDLCHLAETLPQMHLIVDHLAALQFRNDGTILNEAVWLAKIVKLAVLPNVFIKFSGWTTPARTVVKAEQVIEPLAFLLGKFGPKRVLYGGDWPPALVSSNYQTLVDESRRAINLCAAGEEEQIMCQSVFNAYPRAGRTLDIT